jgi:hypothetical protein
MKAANRNAWLIAIVSSVIGALLTIGYDYSKSNPLLTITGFFKYLIHLVSALLLYDIKVWWLLLALIIVVVFVFMINVISKESSQLPEFLNYTEDILKKWKWSWKWEFGNQGWTIQKLTAHCPSCDTKLIEHKTYYGPNFECPRCRFHADEKNCEMPYQIESLICDNIERNKKKEVKKEI